MEIEGSAKSPALCSIKDEELILAFLYGNDAFISFELSNMASSRFYGDLAGDLAGDLPGDLPGEPELILFFCYSTNSVAYGIRS